MNQAYLPIYKVYTLLILTYILAFGVHINLTFLLLLIY